MWGWLRRGQLGSEADRATFRTLHTASLAAPALRSGLNEESAERSVRHLRVLLGTRGVCLADDDGVLAHDGIGDHHLDALADVIALAMGGEGQQVARLYCPSERCPVTAAIVTPLIVEEQPVGTLIALSEGTSAALLRACDEVATWVSGQLDLAQLDASRHRLMQAEVRALRAQISPHFIYNSLGAIASFVRTDPERARELLLEFADFTRYSFRQHGEFTTLAEELRSIERYLLLEQARFGDRLKVTLQIAPEVLGVQIPFLCLQPLVENAVQHGLQPKPDGGHIQITARDVGHECEVTIEDDGAGADPAQIERVLAGESTSGSVGLGNVDERLRQTFGDNFGLVVETATEAGMKVIVRVPKFAPGVLR